MKNNLEATKDKVTFANAYEEAEELTYMFYYAADLEYKNIRCLDFIEYPNQVIWLTCHPGKYFYPKETEGYIIK